MKWIFCLVFLIPSLFSTKLDFSDEALYKDFEEIYNNKSKHLGYFETIMDEKIDPDKFFKSIKKVIHNGKLRSETWYLNSNINDLIDKRKNLLTNIKIFTSEQKFVLDNEKYYRDYIEFFPRQINEKVEITRNDISCIPAGEYSIKQILKKCDEINEKNTPERRNYTWRKQIDVFAIDLILTENQKIKDLFSYKILGKLDNIREIFWKWAGQQSNNTSIDVKVMYEDIIENQSIENHTLPYWDKLNLSKKIKYNPLLNDIQKFFFWGSVDQNFINLLDRILKLDFIIQDVSHQRAFSKIKTNALKILKHQSKIDNFFNFLLGEINPKLKKQDIFFPKNKKKMKKSKHISHKYFAKHGYAKEKRTPIQQRKPKKEIQQEIFLYDPKLNQLLARIENV